MKSLYQIKFRGSIEFYIKCKISDTFANVGDESKVVVWQEREKIPTIYINLREERRIR